jgi:hypothetical protein
VIFIVLVLDKFSDAFSGGLGMFGVLSFVLVAVGTVGLLVGEFVEFARAVTLLLAAANMIGLIGVGITLFRPKPGSV